MIERRAAKRIPFHGKAMVRCGGLSVDCGGVDLSENGVRLQLSAPTSAPWQPIDVLLALSQRGGWVQLRARVRRVEADGPALRWGLSFEDPSAHALRAVRETLGQMLTMMGAAELPPPPPPPGKVRQRLPASAARELPPLVPRAALPPPTPRRTTFSPPTRRASLPPLPRRRATPPPLPAMPGTPTDVVALLADDEPTGLHEADTQEDAIFAQAPGMFRIDVLRRRGRGRN